MILATLREHFKKTLYGWVPALDRTAVKHRAQIESLLQQINDIHGLYAMPLAKNFQTMPDYTVHYDWMCLLADRVGEPAGVRTAFRLRWAHGWASQRMGCAPYGQLGDPAYTELGIVLPLEKIFPVMMVLQDERRRVFGIGPCTMTFERTTIEDARQLVDAYRMLCPVKKDFLKLVK
ncbi:hypothetical protein [Micavibrio aeruginosavorus]|uniref:hypothetical protein n=1 Tax=Micavibrio aeruginosavorus TaxID=349221 RepID=UPI001F232A79|nr:hypothetical protein [Micavibrio aeruginosavorus]